MRQFLGLMPNTKQRRRGMHLPKGALPMGFGWAPSYLTKSHKDGMVRAHQPSRCLEPRVENIWPP